MNQNSLKLQQESHLSGLSGLSGELFEQIKNMQGIVPDRADKNYLSVLSGIRAFFKIQENILEKPPDKPDK
ncbi:MAG: hypothetical protein ABFQ95_05355 [Pseudomonadota bacterium]